LLANPTNNKLQRRLIINTVSETQQKQTKGILPAQLTEQENFTSIAERTTDITIRQPHNTATYNKFKHASQTPDCDQGITAVPIGKLQLVDSPKETYNIQLD